MPTTQVTEVNAAQDLVADTSRIRVELDYVEPIPRAEALQRTMAWERAHPPAHFDPRACDDAAEDALLARLAKG